METTDFGNSFLMGKKNIWLKHWTSHMTAKDLTHCGQICLVRQCLQCVEMNTESVT